MISQEEFEAERDRIIARARFRVRVVWFVMLSGALFLGVLIVSKYWVGY